MLKISSRRVHMPETPSDLVAYICDGYYCQLFLGSFFFLSAKSFANATCPAIVEVGLTWDSLDDWVEDESAQIVSTTSVSTFKVAMSSAPDLPTVEFWYSFGHQKIYRHLYHVSQSS